MSRFPVETFLSHRNETVRRGDLLRFTIFLLSEKERQKRQRVSRFSDEKILSIGTESFRRRTVLCFRKLRVSKFLMIKNGRVAHFFVDCFSSVTVPKLLLEEPACLPRTFWYRELLRKEEGRVSPFSVKNFWSQRTKHGVGKN